MRNRIWWLVPALLAIAGCGAMLDEDTAKSTLSQRQRDSVLAKSDFRGASGVDRALRESERASARSASLNVMTDSLMR